ncbi:MAG: class I SAM-dependent methyltransferase [Verrucomicrobiales bacterium]
MNPSADCAAPPSDGDALRRYYRLHAPLYDATRWSFLFGRSGLVTLARQRLPDARRILEIGCGTGKNLESIARAFPDAEIRGLDLSAEMLEQAGKRVRHLGDRVRLLHQAYDHPVGGEEGPFDLVVLSYCLTMINPGYDRVLATCRQDLSPEGLLTIVDFHDSPVHAFRKWMGVNHVRMEGQIQKSLLAQGWRPEFEKVSRAYGGLWRWLTYLGKI